jgi:hypothetical protein
MPWRGLQNWPSVPSAKDVRIEPISSRDANTIVKRYHYSGSVVNNSQLHLGAFLGKRCLGAMQFGPSLDKRKLKGLVAGTGWNNFIELNRMAFADELPRNSESRALAVAFRLIRRNYPHIQWVISFADGAQSGDGTIYRAAGFLLTGIKKITQVWEAPTKARFSRFSLTDPTSKQQQAKATRICRTSSTKAGHILDTGGASMKKYLDAGFRPLPGFQFRYVYFLDPSARSRLTVPVIPFAKIGEMGAGMYRGQPRAESRENAAPPVQGGEGGVNPTSALPPHPRRQA